MATEQTFRSAPTADQIAEANETLGWLSWLPKSDSELIWSRAQGSRWKLICWQAGISRPTAHRHQQRALRRIVRQLNGEGDAPRSRSFRQLPSRNMRHFRFRKSGKHGFISSDGTLIGRAGRS
jgi:hypothetical protein